MIDPTDFDIPVVVNDDVKRWMNYLLGHGVVLCQMAL